MALDLSLPKRSARLFRPYAVEEVDEKKAKGNPTVLSSFELVVRFLQINQPRSLNHTRPLTGKYVRKGPPISREVRFL